MNAPPFIETPVIGNRWAVGLAFQLHIAIVAFVIGAAMMAPVAEWLGRREPSGRLTRLAKAISASIVKLYAFGATWAVFGLVFLFGLYPRLIGVLMGLFFWMAIIVAVIWVVMTTTAYFYDHTWEPLGQRPGMHLAIGLLFVLSTMAFITLISGMAAFQLAPNDASSFPSTLLTSTWLPQVFHRHVGNLSYAGLIIAGYAGARALYRPRGADAREPDRAWFDWLSDTSLLLGVGIALLQPFIGAWYVTAIRAGAPSGFQRITSGGPSWIFLLQLLLVGTVLLLGNLYFALAIARAGEARSRLRHWLRLSLLAFVLFFLLVLLPRAGAPGWLRYVGLGLAGAVSLANLVLYLRARRDFVWGTAPRSASVALVLLGLVAISLLVTMGVLRTRARGPWLINERLPSDAAQSFERRAPEQ
jgi:cytochrome bd-type quinol oxidase subunit 1